MNKLILKTSVLSLSALLLVACGQTKKEQQAEEAVAKSGNPVFENRP